MKKIVSFILSGALMLITANTLLAVIQAFIIAGKSDLELAWAFLMYSLILFQWAFLLVVISYYFIRRKTNSNNRVASWVLGFMTCFLPYLFYCWADEWGTNTIRMAVINCIAFGFMLDWLYQRMILRRDSTETTAP
jgi:hypothetical protein